MYYISADWARGKPASNPTLPPRVRHKTSAFAQGTGEPAARRLYKAREWKNRKESTLNSRVSRRNFPARHALQGELRLKTSLSCARAGESDV